MADVRNRLQHGVTRAQARQAIDTALKVYSRKFPEYKAQTTWLTEHRAETLFHVKGMKLVAKVEIFDRHIDMGMDVPLLLTPFKGQALGLIEREIRKWLKRAEAGEIREV